MTGPFPDTDTLQVTKYSFNAQISFLGKVYIQKISPIGAPIPKSRVTVVTENKKLAMGSSQSQQMRKWKLTILSLPPQTSISCFFGKVLLFYCIIAGFSSSRQSVSACCFSTKVPAHLPNHTTWIPAMLDCVLRHLEETHKRCGGTE